MVRLTFNVTGSKERLDKYIAANSDLSRSMVQKLAKEGRITLNGKTAKAGDLVAEGDVVVLEKPEPKAVELKAEEIDLEVIYEDPHLLVINKPRGMVVHPSKGHSSGTLVNALLGYCTDLSGIGGEIRPGIVHRLDKETSGLLLIAKDDKTHQMLSQALQTHEIKRIYVAVVKGRMTALEGTINAPIGRNPKNRTKMAVVEGGRRAVTHFKVLRLFEKNSFVRLELETGRTHQIRVHMAFAGHPIVGDEVYNPDCIAGGSPLMLHAAVLKFVHPITGESMQFAASLPEEFRAELRRLYVNTR